MKRKPQAPRSAMTGPDRRSRTWRWALLQPLLLAGALTAQGEERQAGSWYTSLGIGWNYAERLHLEESSGVIDFDFGLPAASLAVGWQRSDRWRFELEAAYLENAPEVLFFRGTDLELDTAQKDRLATTAFSVNAIRDFRLGAAFRPYLGLGAGPANLDLSFTAIDEVGDRASFIDDERWSLAWQVIAGLTVPLGERLALGIEYRYWRAPDPGLEDLNGSGMDGGASMHVGWARFRYHPGGHGQGGGAAVRSPAAPGGFYLAASAGGGWGVDRDLKDRTGQLDAFATGPVASVAAGYRFGRRWQVELEAARRRNDMQIFDYHRGEQRTRGDVRADSALVNLLYRFRPAAPVSPLLGVGAGVGRLRYDLDLAAGREPLVRDTATAGVIQLLLGFDMAINRRWSATVDYRAWLSDEVELDTEDGEVLKVNHMIHSWAVGLRYSPGRS